MSRSVLVIEVSMMLEPIPLVFMSLSPLLKGLTVLSDTMVSKTHSREINNLCQQLVGITKMVYYFLAAISCFLAVNSNLRI